MPEKTDNIDTAFKRLESLLAEVEQFGDTLFTKSDISGGKSEPPHVVSYHIFETGEFENELNPSHELFSQPSPA